VISGIVGPTTLRSA